MDSTLNLAALTAALESRGLPQLTLRSAAADRTTYLRRPDLGRTLSRGSAAALAAGGPSFPALSERVGYSRHARTALPTPPTTLAILLADGLCAEAINRNAIPLLDELLPLLKFGAPEATWRLTPVVLAEQARVALGDEAGAALQADVTLILIGERPGLSSPDSLGAYITWAPRPGRNDAERNCVSNIRAGGLDYATAARKIAWYLAEGRRLGLTGVALRESDAALLPLPTG